MKQRNLKLLAEELKSLSKYPDRAIVDYWRTIQGTHVGFSGDPKAGAGIPVAGPPVLTGGSASGNPLLDPLLKKYPSKTFIGDAIRKPNFPLTVVNFIEKFVGKDEAAIKARFAEMEKRAVAFAFSKEEIARAEKERFDAKEKFVGINIDVNGKGDKFYLPYANHWHNPVVFSKQENKFLNNFKESKQVQDYVDDLNRRGIGVMKPMENAKVEDIDPDAYSDIYKNLFQKSDKYNNDGESDVGPHRMLIHHFEDPSSTASILYKIMQMEGVAGTFGKSDAATSYIKDKSDFRKNLNPINTDYEKCKEYLGDLYVLNQIFMKARGQKTEKVTRGLGGVIYGLGTNLESQKVVAKLAQNGVSMRFMNRPVSGFASGGASSYTGWTITAEVPAEAILSSTLGAKIQGDRYSNEKEALVIGASSLPFSPDQISFVTVEKESISSAKIAEKINKFKQNYLLY